MQREYLFRGKRRDNGSWMFGLIGYDSGGGYGRISGWMGDDGGEKFNDVEVISETVGQYTGLKDRNEKDIYEGDILRSFSQSIPSYEVFYYKGCYRLRYKLKNSEWYDWGPLFRMEEIQWERRSSLCPEVIGNIYEHSHLLNPAGGTASSINMNYTDPNAKQEQTEPAQEAAEQATQSDANGTSEATPEGESEGE